MPNIQADGLADIITASLPELGRGKLTDLASDYHSTVALKRIINAKKSQVDSGSSIRFNITYDVGGSFRFVPMFFTAIANFKNTQAYGDVPWRGFTWNWSMEDCEPIMNSGAAKIIDVMKTRRATEMASVIEGLERHLWTAPDPTDDVSIFPIPYYVVKSNTAATTANNNGFNGTVPTGFTAVAGLDPTTAPGTPGGRYRNYATQYTTVAKTDLIRKMRRGAKYTKFEPILEGVALNDPGDDMGWYTNYAVVSVVEEILEAQNEDLGTDAASMDGKAIVLRAPLNCIQELDNDITNPVYGLQWAALRFTRMRNMWMKDYKVSINPNQPTVATVHNVSRLNTVCVNRRRQMVFATDTTMPS